MSLSVHKGNRINYVRSLMYIYSWISTLIDRPRVPVGDVGERRGRGGILETEIASGLNFIPSTRK